MRIHPTDYLVHFSNLLVSYSVRNILWLLYEHQPVSDLAHLHEATPGGAVPRRADTLRHGVPLAHAARLRRPRHGGRMERWGDRRQDTERGTSGVVRLCRDTGRDTGPRAR